MSKKTLTIIIAVSIISLLGGVGVMFFSKGNTSQETTSEDGGGLKFRDFFTIGGGGGTQEDNTTENETTEIPFEESTTTPEVAQKLRQISFEPTTGYGTLTFEREIVPEVIVPPTIIESSTPPVPKKFEQISSVRYQDKTTGHIYHTYLDKINPEKISNTTIPKVHHSYFVNKGEGLIDQYLTVTRSIETYYGGLTKDTEGNYISLVGSFLPKDILDMSVSLDASKIFYLSTIEGGVVGTVASPKGDSKVQVFTSKFSEWISQFPNNKLVTLTTKASARSLGYMYTVDTTTKSFDKVLGGITGLTTLTSPDGKNIIYSSTHTGGFSSNIYNKETKKALTLGLTTLPEKCVWSGDSKNAYCAVPQTIQNAEYPDAWYQGIVSFNDSFWKLDTETNIFELVYDSATEGRSFDGINLQLSPDEKYLLFMNKGDNQLWGITL